MIVATAGHIDHGKTLLVKTITGVDTDRLPEEKARGMSIDLGFAYWPQPDGRLIGFVDLPGHERFIRNMLAGATGIDFALLVVAADDGVMPQTVEHLQILDLLNIRRGLVAITKTDRVPAKRVAIVRDEVRGLLDATNLAQAAVLDVSAVTGMNMDVLRAALSEASRVQVMRFTEGRHFRFAIDRSFTSKGSGTVVTGTVFDGEVKTGDELVVSPRGTAVRVRGVQVHGRSVSRAEAGTRCAVSITGTEHKQVRRGDWLLDAEIHAPTQRLDVRLSLLAGESAALEGGAQLHVHIATAEVIARARTQHGRQIAPGHTAIVQLVLETPVGALHGDRLIIRDHSAQRTLGGGIVLDPFAPDINPGRASRAGVLAALDTEDATIAVSTLLEMPQIVLDSERLACTFNLTAQKAASVYRAAGATVFSCGLAIPSEAAATVASQGEERIREFHRDSPRLPGMELGDLRAELAPHLPAELFAEVLRTAGSLSIRGSIVAHSGHSTTSNTADDAMWQRVLAALIEDRFLPSPVADLARRLSVDELALADFLYRKAKTGEIKRVTEDRFYPKATLAELARIAADLAQSAPNGMFTAAQYRDSTGMGRTLAIKLLEFFDGAGVTQRVGDARRVRKGYAVVFADRPPS